MHKNMFELDGIVNCQACFEEVPSLLLKDAVAIATVAK